MSMEISSKNVSNSPYVSTTATPSTVNPWNHGLKVLFGLIRAQIRGGQQILFQLGDLILRSNEGFPTRCEKNPKKDEMIKDSSDKKFIFNIFLGKILPSNLHHT